MEKKKFTTKKFLFIFALLGIFFSFFQPTCGAFTRVTDSGDGCPDWPTCFGSWIPPLNDIHAIIEWSHRTSGTLFGIVSIFLVVLSELNPAIRTVHLAGAQTVAALMVATFIIQYLKPVETNNKIKILAFITAFLAIASLLSGAYAVWQGAGSVCYRWPLCDDYLIPRFTNQWIHMIHRIISLVLILHILRLSIVLIKTQSGNILSKAGYLLLAMGTLQTIIGATIPISDFSVWSRSLHLGLATIVWMVTVSIIMLIKVKKP